jgi:thiopurine S-methyltransferase
MSEKTLDGHYWQERYTKSETGWNIGNISTPIAAYVDQLEDKNLKILIPGCGNAYEGEYLWKKGFRHVWLSDLADTPRQNFLTRVPDFPPSQWLSDDFFAINEVFDLVLEQTFYCALHPDLRDKYVQKMVDIIRPGGTLAGVLFDFPLSTEGPPFGGSREEYLQRFSPFFELKLLEKCYNSIAPRMGRELFIIAKRK